MTIAPALPLERIPAIRPIAEHCLCPGCYFMAARRSELCDRCTLDGCDHQENRHHG